MWRYSSVSFGCRLNASGSAKRAELHQCVTCLSQNATLRRLPSDPKNKSEMEIRYSLCIGVWGRGRVLGVRRLCAKRSTLRHSSDWELRTAYSRSTSPEEPGAGVRAGPTRAAGCAIWKALGQQEPRTRAWAARAHNRAQPRTAVLVARGTRASDSRRARLGRSITVRAALRAALRAPLVQCVVVCTRGSRLHEGRRGSCVHRWCSMAAVIFAAGTPRTSSDKWVQRTTHRELESPGRAQIYSGSDAICIRTHNVHPALSATCNCASGAPRHDRRSKTAAMDGRSQTIGDFNPPADWRPERWFVGLDFLATSTDQGFRIALDVIRPKSPRPSALYFSQLVHLCGNNRLIHRRRLPLRIRNYIQWYHEGQTLEKERRGIVPRRRPFWERNLRLSAWAK
ncbi:hypothetical protein DFH07DRAFT_940159 [Mycena maculata]|uniref:Uncharacterized protein n=1 Tax=Mycena maculata TaxID=230809 RepID=A0AAD7JCH4_9AGAR|nr:hypothetical protein DFH07DRAFT_940159 [Mycena maculata]